MFVELLYMSSRLCSAIAAQPMMPEFIGPQSGITMPHIAIDTPITHITPRFMIIPLCGLKNISHHSMLIMKISTMARVNPRLRHPVLKLCIGVFLSLVARNIDVPARNTNAVAQMCVIILVKNKVLLIEVWTM